MTLSVFDLYSIGIGPSSSHTVGPMRAAKRFVDGLSADGDLGSVARVRAELFGSLGATGRGHASDKAVVLGLEGEDPATVDTRDADRRVAAASERGTLRLAGHHPVSFDGEADVVLHRRQTLPGHPNGMVFTALGRENQVLRRRTYFSVGGGFVVDEDDLRADTVAAGDAAVPYPFATVADLTATCARTGLAVSDVVLANERTWRPEQEVRAGLLHVWSIMAASIEAGCRTEGVLPGGLGVPRRAPGLHRSLSATPVGQDPLDVMDWVNVFALAVNEENAAGGRIVTAPTNGAAGIVPAVLCYYVRFIAGADDDGIVRLLAAAAAIGMVIKRNASISGAEVGCQGEVGSACAMAAGGLCEVLGGSPSQVENAAEIALEHNLGLTCDPVAGLVQIPCIERNAIAAMKAINAARLALHGNGTHSVSLDAAIRTMRDIGRDMHTKYKETSLGGLAVNITEC